MRKLIDQIVTRELDTAINMIIASPDMVIDFDAAVAHIKGYIGNKKEDALVTGKRGRDGRHIASVDTRHRAPNEWKQIPKEERRRQKQKRESGSNKDKDASNGSKYQGPKKGRTTFKELKRRIAELESKEAANGNRNENRDEDGDGNDGNAGNGDGNRSNPALQRK